MFLRYLIFATVLSIASSAAHAENFSCPGGVLFEEGPVWEEHEPGYFAIEQDIGGDYDENAPQAEWNELNYDSSVSVLIHCYTNKLDGKIYRKNREQIDIWLPREIKRCIAKDDKLFCTSDTIACHGYVGDAVIEAISNKGYHRLIRSDTEKKKNKSKNKNKEWLNLNPDSEETLLANCYPETWDSRGDYTRMPIPPEMKTCRLENRRFICSKNSGE